MQRSRLSIIGVIDINKYNSCMELRSTTLIKPSHQVITHILRLLSRYLQIDLLSSIILYMYIQKDADFNGQHNDTQ